MHNDGINLIRANNNSGKGEDSGLIATIKTLLKSLDFKWGGGLNPQQFSLPTPLFRGSLMIRSSETYSRAAPTPHR